ncbi:hypothetical protein [Aquipseudomonas alcaligenes]|uniref:Uncharacterized protein n=1 Tax=Aquipseudomonas alcaligenes TaxID=43263 RepID=A0AB73I367_AQUAC|nr:hypothetical protein [Pseudomonas alcaligenes]MDH0144610.1 hypothetical protein [Pseudomonas alcaligenes]
MNIELIRRLCLARHLFELGTSSLRTSNDMHLFAAVNLMQDAVEAFLIGIAEEVAADIDQNTKYDKYFTQIDAKINPKQLPFKLPLMRLNRVRVDSKHYGIQPSRDECNRLSVSVREFLEEVSTSVLGVSFSTISALDLLDEGEPKDHLVAAKQALESGDYVGCAVECRKAIYIEVESKYDISEYKDGKPKGLLAGFTLAPFYARSAEYIAKNVREPTDYIVFDHARVDQELLTNRVDVTEFWNIWRLTPQLYRFNDGVWVVKHDLDKLNPDTISDKAPYIYATTVDVLLAMHTSRRKTKSNEYTAYSLELTQDAVPVYEKADEGSKLVGHTRAGQSSIGTDYYVPGLNGDGPYWFVRHIEKGYFILGYIHNSYVK